jgi:predicted secreted acid phosphatase
MGWLEAWLKFKKLCGVKNGVVIFDIDDTLVDSDEKRISPVVNLFKLSQKFGFACSIVTARQEGLKNRNETAEMLQKCGIENWTHLYMMPSALRGKIKTEEQLRRYVSAYKSDARDQISQTYDIIANIGDMWHDLIKYPLATAHMELKDVSAGECAIFFPVNQHNEVAIKVHGRTA